MPNSLSQGTSKVTSPSVSMISGIVIRKQLRPDAQVVVHVGNHAFDMMLRGFDGRIRGAEPELLIGVEPEVTGNVENLAEAQLTGQALAVPPVNGLVPPHGPFPTRQPVHRLKIHDGAKSFNVIHGNLVGFCSFRLSRQVSERFGLCDRIGLSGKCGK